MRALLICNRPERLTSMIQCLREAGHEVKASSAEMALTAINQNRPDLIFITTWDISSLPSFFLKLQRLYGLNQRNSYYPVTIAITHHEEVDLDGLYNMGFDLASEIPLREPVLMAQVMALDRRLGISCRTLASPHLLVDLHTHRVFLKANQGTLLASLNVGQIQFILLKCFLRYPQRIWTRPELLEQLSIESESQRITESLDIRVVDGNIYRLRKAIRDALEGVPKGWWIDKRYKEGFFHTERSGGYFFLDAIRMEGEIDASEFHLAQQTAMSA